MFQESTLEKSQIRTSIKKERLTDKQTKNKTFVISRPINTTDFFARLTIIFELFNMSFC